MALSDDARSALTRVWQQFLVAFQGFLHGFMAQLFGGKSPTSTVEQAGAVVGEALQATLALLATEAGIRDPAQLLLTMREIHDQTQAANPDASGDAKYSLADSALRIAWREAGGAPTSPALQTLIDIFTAIFHAKTKLAEIVPPDAAHTVGMVNP